MVLKNRRIARFWPGFARLWYRGDPVGLIAAIFYGLLLNTALLCTFVWTEIASVKVQVILWCASGLCLIYSATYSFICVKRDASMQDTARDLLSRAQREYLRGQWSEAESKVRQILKRQPDDVEARLFLATILRHTKRPSEAMDELRRLSRKVGSAKWCMEIDHEWRQLRRRSPTLLASESETREHNTKVKAA